MHLAVAGNIGSGKTTLTTLLANHYRYTPHVEEVDNNPYLNDFYKDMTRWSFNLQVYFLRSRFSQLIEMKKKEAHHPRQNDLRGRQHLRPQPAGHGADDDPGF